MDPVKLCVTKLGRQCYIVLQKYTDTQVVQQKTTNHPNCIFIFIVGRISITVADNIRFIKMKQTFPLQQKVPPSSYNEDNLYQGLFGYKRN